MGIPGEKPPTIPPDIEWSWDEFQEVWYCTVQCLRITWENFTDGTHRIYCGGFERHGKLRGRSLGWIEDHLLQLRLALNRNSSIIMFKDLIKSTLAEVRAEELADVFAVSVDTIERWASGKVTPSKYVRNNAEFMIEHLRKEQK